MSAPLKWHRLKNRKNRHLATEGDHRALCGEDVLFAEQERQCHVSETCQRCVLLAEGRRLPLPPTTSVAMRDNTTRGLFS